MNSKSLTSRRAGALALLVLLLLPAPILFAAIPVIDGANLAQNILQVLRAIDQIQNQIEQLELMLKNLERIDEPSWRDLGPYLLTLNELARQGLALGYSTEGVFEAYRDLMPGFVPIEPEGYAVTYSEWIETSLDTLAASLDTARAQSEDYLPTQEQLFELQEIADSAEGNLEALHTSNMFLSHLAQEVAKLNQLQAAHLGAQNVALGMTLNIEASREATLRLLIEESLEIPSIYSGKGGFTGIPENWPYPCFGCSS